VRTFVELIALVSQDTDQLRKLTDIDVAIDDSDATTASTFNSTQMTLAAGASGVSIPFGGVTRASTLLIIAQSDISVQLNGSGVPYEVLHTPAALTSTVLSTVQRFSQPGVVFWRGNFDSVVVNNLSSVDTADVYIALTGEVSQGQNT